MNKLLKTIKNIYSIFSICLIVLGIFLIFKPESSLYLIFKIAGFVFIGFGISKIIGYFTKDFLQLAFQHDLAMGVISILIGISLFFYSDNVIRILSICIGLFMVIDALLKIQTSIDARKIGIGRWQIILFIGIITALIGGLLFFKPFESTKLILQLTGFNLFIDGLLNLFVVQSTVETINKNNIDF